MAELETRGGRRFRPAWLLGALVAFVLAIALTSTWYRRGETVEGATATVYGVLALLCWLTTAGCIAAAVGFAPRRR